MQRPGAAAGMRHRWDASCLGRRVLACMRPLALRHDDDQDDEGVASDHCGILQALGLQKRASTHRMPCRPMRPIGALGMLTSLSVRSLGAPHPHRCHLGSSKGGMAHSSDETCEGARAAFLRRLARSRTVMLSSDRDPSASAVVAPLLPAERSVMLQWRLWRSSVWGVTGILASR